MKVYLPDYIEGAGRWIYEGYKNAWKALGHEPIMFRSLDQIEQPKEPYCLQIVDSHVTNEHSFSIVKNAVRACIFVQPQSFPDPWGKHPNFKCHCPEEYIDKVNNLDNIFLWAFDPRDGHTSWSNITQLPMAFDHIAYSTNMITKLKFDVCYIGGRANNAFDEKYQLMHKYFSKIDSSKIKMGIFINKNLPHPIENTILCGSKICLNIHDRYQRVLNTKDTNERTFKSLGCNGLLLSDRENFIPNTFPRVDTFDTPEDMIELIDHYLTMPEEHLLELKQYHKDLIMEKHTYVHRVSLELEGVL